MLNLTPWLYGINHADDLDFQEVLIDYVAALNDAHSYIAFPSSFGVSLPIGVDIYDGRVLIDGINRTALPVAQYPFTVGDELLSVDGVPVHNLIRTLRKYAVSGNLRSTDRTAAGRIVGRSQQIMPHLPGPGNATVIVIRPESTGVVSTCSIPWSRTGIPVTSQGPVPSPKGWSPLTSPSTFSPTEPHQPSGAATTAGATPRVFQVANIAPADNTLPAYMEPIVPLLNGSLPKDYYSVPHFGGKFPIPAAPYIENVGLRPDIVEDCMIRANLVSGGEVYVRSFTSAITDLVVVRSMR